MSDKYLMWKENILASILFNGKLITCMEKINIDFYIKFFMVFIEKWVIWIKWIWYWNANICNTSWIYDSNAYMTETLKNFRAK